MKTSLVLICSSFGDGVERSGYRRSIATGSLQVRSGCLGSPKNELFDDMCVCFFISIPMLAAPAQVESMCITIMQLQKTRRNGHSLRQI